MKKQRIACCLAVGLMMIVACDSQDPIEEELVGGSPAPGSGMLLVVTPQGTPEYNKPLTITFTYEVDTESGWEMPDTLIASAFIQSLAPAFELVSGDSSWVDTLLVGDKPTHSFVVRPLKRASVYSCVLVSAYVEEALTVGAADCATIDTR